MGTTFKLRTTSGKLLPFDSCSRRGDWGGKHHFQKRWFGEGLRCEYCHKLQASLEREYAAYLAVNTPELRRAQALAEGYKLYPCAHCEQECALNGLGWQYTHVSWTSYATYACQGGSGTVATPVGALPQLLLR